jgi:adenosine deaminase
MSLRWVLSALLVAFISALPGALRADPPSAATLTAQRFEAARARPDRLLAFLAAMPKGADLHDHADGAVYAEDMLAWAIADNACYVPATLALDERCSGDELPLTTGIARDPNLAASIVRALSMETFDSATESGHDHFFNTFDKFGSIAARHPDRVLAAATSEAARSGVTYLELMTALDAGAARTAASDAAHAHAFDPADLHADDTALDAAFAKLIPSAFDDARTIDAQRSTDLGCGTATPDPGCRVTVRYIQSVIRVEDPASVFAQTRLAFELAHAPGSGFVAINFVAPEDAPVALRDYALHMRMIAYFHRKYPRVAITLHAGELTPALAGPAALADHIRLAVEVAGARRIGHGVDVLGERDAHGLLREMAQRRILVEIALTSNDLILNVRGTAHPLRAYLAAGVPVALVTDDAGVARSDLTHEFARAATTYGFRYPELKTFARNSVHYAFLPGRSLWRDDRYRVPAPECAQAGAQCSAFRANNPRAAEEWRLERALAAFEAHEGASPL